MASSAPRFRWIAPGQWTLASAVRPIRKDGERFLPESTRCGGCGGRRLALPKSIRQWSLTTLREKLVKIGAKVTRHSKYVTFQLAEVAVPRQLFAAILERIGRLAMPLAVCRSG